MRGVSIYYCKVEEYLLDGLAWLVPAKMLALARLARLRWWGYLE